MLVTIAEGYILVSMRMGQKTRGAFSEIATIILYYFEIYIIIILLTWNIACKFIIIFITTIRKIAVVFCTVNYCNFYRVRFLRTPVFEHFCTLLTCI